MRMPRWGPTLLSHKGKRCAHRDIHCSFICKRIWRQRLKWQKTRKVEDYAVSHCVVRPGAASEGDRVWLWLLQRLRHQRRAAHSCSCGADTSPPTATRCAHPTDFLLDKGRSGTGGPSLVASRTPAPELSHADNPAGLQGCAGASAGRRGSGVRALAALDRRRQVREASSSISPLL